MQEFSEIDALIIKNELEGKLKERRVKRVSEMEGGFVVEFEGEYNLLVDLRPRYLRVHLTQRSSQSLFSSLDQELRRLILKGIKLREGDRVFYFLFKGRGEERILVVELTGRHSNAMVLDSRGVILFAFKEIGKELSRVREVKPGLMYKPPPRKPSSLLIDRPDGRLEEKTPYLKFIGTIDKSFEHFLPVLYLNEKLTPEFYSPIEIAGASKFRVYGDLYSSIVELYFDWFERRVYVERSLERFEKMRRRLEEELERLKDYELERRRGELILANLGKLKGKWGKFEIEGVEFEIEKGKTPEEMASHYFKLYKKKKAGLEKVREKLKNLRLIVDSAKVPTVHEEKEPYYVYRTPNGFRVLVGKNARSNELVTFEIAKKRDLFFHVKDSPGAHVILIREGREPEEEDILFAARLALLHSKAALNGKGLVSVAEVKDLKRAGDRRGAVLISNEKVLHVRL